MHICVICTGSVGMYIIYRIYIHTKYIYYYTFLCIYTFLYVIFLPLGNNIACQCHRTFLFFVPLSARQCQCCEGHSGCGRGAVRAGKPCCFPEMTMVHATSCSVASSSITLCAPGSRLHVTAEEQKVSSAPGLQIGVRSARKQFCGYKETYPDGFPSGIRFLVFTLS